MDVLKWIAGIVLVLVLIVGGFFMGRWEYRECKHVGHSTAYCLTHDGGNNQ